MNNEAMTLENKKQRLWKKYATSRCVKCKTNLRKLTRTLKEIFERKLVINSKNKRKPFG